MMFFTTRKQAREASKGGSIVDRGADYPGKRWGALVVIRKA